MGDYYAAYELFEGARASKQEAVRRVIESQRPQIVWDVGRTRVNSAASPPNRGRDDRVRWRPNSRRERTTVNAAAGERPRILRSSSI